MYQGCVISEIAGRYMNQCIHRGHISIYLKVTCHTLMKDPHGINAYRGRQSQNCQWGEACLPASVLGEVVDLDLRLEVHAGRNHGAQGRRLHRAHRQSGLQHQDNKCRAGRSMQNRLSMSPVSRQDAIQMRCIHVIGCDRMEYCSSRKRPSQITRCMWANRRRVTEALRTC